MKKKYCGTIFVLFMLPLAFAPNIQKTLAQGMQSNNLVFSVLQNAYSSRINESRWNPNADLNNDGRVNLQDLVLYCRIDAPLILDISSNLFSGYMLPESGIPTFNVTVIHADQCILSYMYDYLGNASEWVNQTMTKQGNFYIGSIDTDSIPGGANQGPDTDVYYKIYSTNSFGYAETPSLWFQKWMDP